MRQNSLRAIWAQQGAALGGWLTLPSSVSAEVMAHCGFDWVCIDLQHGLIDYSEMVQMLQGISSTATVPLVRVPWNEPGIIGKCLDAGAWDHRADGEFPRRGQCGSLGMPLCAIGHSELWTAPSELLRGVRLL